MISGINGYLGVFPKVLGVLYLAPLKIYPRQHSYCFRMFQFHFRIYTKHPSRSYFCIHQISISIIGIRP